MGCQTKESLIRAQLWDSSTPWLENQRLAIRCSIGLPIVPTSMFPVIYSFLSFQHVFTRFFAHERTYVVRLMHILAQEARYTWPSIPAIMYLRLQSEGKKLLFLRSQFIQARVFSSSLYLSEGTNTANFPYSFDWFRLISLEQKKRLQSDLQ